MAFAFSGAFAQTTITVIDFSGANATAPTISSIAAGVETPLTNPADYTVGGAGGNVITTTATLGVGTYAIYDGSGERTTFITDGSITSITVRTHTIAFSQDGNYEQNAEEVYQTVGSTFRLYADPDPIYNPSYAGAGTLDANALWTWDLGDIDLAPDAAIGGSWVDDATGINENYVEITAPSAAGSYTISVTESNTAVACTDNGQSIAVNVIAAPIATITTLDPAVACGDQAAAAVAMTFTEAVPAALAGYAFAVTESIDNLSDLGGSPTVTNVTSTADFVDYPTDGKLNTGNALTGAASPYGFTFNTSALTVRNNQITRYTYTLVKATNQGASASASGLISAISQKSEYIDVIVNGGDINTYPWGAKSTFIAIVVPQPQTGPIYYIPNDYAY